MASMMRLLLLLSAFMAALVGQVATAHALPTPVCEVASRATVKPERFVPVSRSIAKPERRALRDAGSLAFEAIVFVTSAPPIYAQRLRV